MKDDSKEMKSYLTLGNFYQARKLARQLLSSSKNKIEAERCLKIASADKINLALAFVCLIFSVTVAWLVAY